MIVGTFYNIVAFLLELEKTSKNMPDIHTFITSWLCCNCVILMLLKDLDVSGSHWET